VGVANMMIWLWVRKRSKSSRTSEYVIESYGIPCWNEEEKNHVLQREDIIEAYEGSSDEIHLLADLRDMGKWRDMEKVLGKMKRVKP
jgi:hypothetical protein